MSLPSKSLVRDDKKQHMSAKISKHAIMGLNDFRSTFSGNMQESRNTT